MIKLIKSFTAAAKHSKVTTDFNSAAKDLRDVLPTLVCDDLTSLPFKLDDVPFYDKGPWSSGRNACNNNCYNFALNRRSNDFLQPGHLYCENEAASEEECSNLKSEFDKKAYKSYRKLSSYVDNVIEKASMDGLKPLGHDLSLIDSGFPVALFFRDGDTDYHWYALRRLHDSTSEIGDRLVWAHKMGYGYSQIVKKDSHDPSHVFDDAKSNKYKYFAGYFQVDNSLSL